jgi:hypothetical protein
MNSSGSNGIVKYDVIYSKAVLQALRRLLDGLSGVERLQGASALRIIDKRLRNDPLNFGESRFNQSGKPHTVCNGGVLPLIVRFAVYAERREVWILGFHIVAR